MIWCYSGTPGSGKSAHLAADIRFALNRPCPRPVIANFPLASDAPVKHWEYFRYIPNNELTPEGIMALCEYWWKIEDFREEGILLALDEVQMLFNSREWQQKGNRRMEWLELFSQSRKWGLKVVFVAQNVMMIDNQFRMLIEYDVLHRKVSNYGMFGWLLALPFAGRLVVRNTVYLPLKQQIETEFGLMRRKDFRMYDSYARFERTDGGAASVREGARALPAVRPRGTRAAVLDA